MDNEKIIKNVTASFAMKGLKTTKEDEERGRKILNGEIDIKDAIAEIKKKYESDRNNTGENMSANQKSHPYSIDEIIHLPIDYKGMVKYARSVGKSVPDLSDSEKEKFMNGHTMQELKDQLGVTGTLKFLSQFDGGGSGDYTEEKYNKEDKTLMKDEIIDMVRSTR